MQFQIKSQPGVHAIWQSLSVIYKEGQRAKRSQDIPEELQGVGLGLPGINTYNIKWSLRHFKALVVGVVWFGLRDRHIGHWIRLESPETDSRIMEMWSREEVVLKITQKMNYSISRARTVAYPYGKKPEITSLCI